METKKIILLSISSDIAFEVANDLLKKKFKIIFFQAMEEENVRTKNEA